MSIVDPLLEVTVCQLALVFPSESVQTLLFEELGHRMHAQKLRSGDKTS